MIVSLSSGSKANCTLVSDGKTHILIDLGLSCRRVRTCLRDYGLDLCDISAVFITHEHIDHVAGLPTFSKQSAAPIYMTEPSYLDYIRTDKGFDLRNRITKTDTEYSFAVGTLNVTSLPVRHDSAACVAIKVRSDAFTLGLCTDVGYPNDELFGFFSDCGCVITEANYDEQMLLCGIYPQVLKYRIMGESGHTSNADCADFVCRLARSGVRRFLLAHVSPENNTPALAVYVVAEALKKQGLTVDFLAAAPRDEAIAFI